MSAPTIDELLAAWSRRTATRPVGGGDACHRAALGLLADGEPVDPADIARAADQPLEQVRTWLERMRTTGYELDDQGLLIGAALSLRPTRHRFTVRGHGLYAWCGFDTLFLPILLDESADVASTCPATGQHIELRVAADGTVTDAAPATTVVAVVGSEVLEACDSVGPGTAICDQMPLLADPGAAQQWVEGRDGVTIVDLDSASQLARGYARHRCC